MDVDQAEIVAVIGKDQAEIEKDRAGIVKVDSKVEAAMLQHQEVMADSESCPLVKSSQIKHVIRQISTSLSSLNRSATQGNQV